LGGSTLAGSLALVTAAGLGTGASTFAVTTSAFGASAFSVTAGGAGGPSFLLASLGEIDAGRCGFAGAASPAFGAGSGLDFFPETISGGAVGGWTARGASWTGAGVGAAICVSTGKYGICTAQGGVLSV
jgi:hypothetical protein